MLVPGNLPTPSKTDVRIGYLRLTDSAPLIIAKELGFFEAAGLSVELCQEVSWANVRDKLVAGLLDAAQMLAPLPAMSTLGASGLRAPLLTGLVLSNNGNAITLSQDIWQQGQDLIAGGECESLLEVLHHLAVQRQQPLTLATVHAFSTHTILMRRWLQSGGIDPDRDLKIIVVPPVQMVDSLQSGVIDGYCVGEPWNTIAVQQGLGAVAAMGLEIWSGAPEKVLAVSAAWQEEQATTHACLRVALLAACRWLSRAENVDLAVQLMSAREYLNLPAEKIFPSLTGALRSHMSLPGRRVSDFHMFYGKGVNRPDHKRARVMLDECASLLGKPIDGAVACSLVEQTFREDLFEETLALFAASVDQTDLV